METVHGKLRGSVADGVQVFRGMPYAAPPFGPNRLRPPRPVEPWSGVRDAVELGPEPPQVTPPTTGGPGSGVSGDWREIDESFAEIERAAPSEDCLNLNVWTPDREATRLPVMVWIQGGMFEISSTAAYDGSRFARDGVVCVVITWRPGAEGFLFLGDGVANVGLLDQVAALEWVRENIAAFGGDPGNVTVFGESAGAMSIGMLLAMPRAAGLFRRAILQSGAAHHVTPAEDARRISGYLAERLGVPATREAIAAVGVERFVAVQSELKAELFADPDPGRWGSAVVASNMPWQPVIDGQVLPGRPIDLIAAGSSGDVDVIVGTNTDDWRLWSVVSGMIGQMTDEILTGPVEAYGNQSLGAYGLPVAEALAAYRARYPESTPGELLATVQTDWWMRIPALRLADARADARAVAVGGTYMYEFAWPSPGLGAVHALEIPFVFDIARPDIPLFGPMLGQGPPQALADLMHSAWVSFATNGDPGWPSYDLGRRATMRFDTASQVVEDPRRWERELWRGIR
ncbi:carboxylesterase family protein [Agromyces bauzanensis]|uniref:Carboxylic ester hydrolase n=1 Tax=Agromyces bauzanensis TaxID=1308924 RepID=A0A917UVS5_9MICO|nr:carboxylic ester hydrolase [Agromyces bauzanensis]